ncbi:5-bromo-4-chloroindolyl phosphate hydrolysis family protein [Fredinandcohnia quinoae]|uniref:5-bromo-4-chloroindolyl phosphate hydrolysis family protein n=1 Tax=Fredinandcohnia quinoae TaxID=2918902 RepID=A0AAW5E3G4_9BACI|nr:5-bromo-4-chloroindolyl phosphate hydrolysis family protein [Fredinandcohnia sp. SECRCQ15]MCH1624085.1 5-bromo-4-chloroindolyl phosphate hydrolysis family protein [Fredinandcohnia sp. SECRCQ15]
MNPFLSFIIKSMIAFPTMVTVWFVSFFPYDQTYLLSSTFAIIGGGVTYFFSSLYMNNRFLKKHRLTRKEYKYINKNLSESKKKLARLSKALFSIRHVPSIKQRIDLHRITKKIYRLAKSEPKRFYQAEPFFFSHLDSVVELTEKYALLSSQPRKSKEIEHSLHETRRVLEDLTHTIEKDLYKMLSNDIDELHFEIDVAKHTNKNMNDSQIINNNRR